MAAPTVAARPAVGTPPGAPPPRPPGHRRTRRWPRRVLIGLNVFVALCLMAAASLYGYVRYRFGQVSHITISSLIHGAAPDGNKTAGSSYAGPPMNILVVGSDTRNLSAADKGKFGVGSADVGGQRSDTIMLVHLNPAAGTASLLSIPRDLWVDIPGKGKNRVNTAFDTSADLLVRTIQDDLGIPINHFVEVNFDSFRQVVNALGGVKFWYPEPVKDSDNGVNDSGLNITKPGCYNLSGDMALSLVRTRHLIYQTLDGRWHAEAESDLARIRRQQMFVKKVISKAQSSGLADVTKINGVIGGIVGNLTVDSGLSSQEMLALARRYRHFDSGTLPTATLPTYGANIGGASVLLLQKDQAQQVINTWEGLGATASTPTTAAGSTSGAAASITPSSVSVGVLNGSGVSHQASQAVSALQSAGFVAGSQGDVRGFGYGTTVIKYAPGDQATAQFLQARVVGWANLQSDSTLTAGHLVLITGSSYTGITSATGGTTPATSTPAAPAASTPSAAAAAPTPTTQPPFPGPQGGDPPPPGSGC